MLCQKSLWCSITVASRMKEECRRQHNGPKDLLITKTCLYKFDALKPHFYIVKLGFTGVYIIFLISAQKHRLWVPIKTVSMRQL